MNQFLFTTTLALCLAHCAVAQLPLGPRSVAPGHRIVRRDSRNEAVTAGKQRKDSDMMLAEPSSSSYGQSSGGSGGYGGNAQQAGGYGMQSGYQQAEPQHPPMPFAWGYDINDGYGTSQFHKENGDENGKRTGSYGYMDAYGVYRQVEYEADHNGFRAVVKTNEPGTTSDDPADVDMTAEAPPAQTNPGSGNKGSSYKQQSYGGGGGNMSAGRSYGGGESNGGSSPYGGSNAKQQGGYSGGSPMTSMKQAYGGGSSMMMMPMRRSYGGNGAQMTSPPMMRKPIGGGLMESYGKPPQRPMNLYK